jgi:histone H3/H4
MQGRDGKQSSFAIQEVTRQAVSRMAHKAGVKTVSRLIPEEARGIITVVLNYVISHIHDTGKTRVSKKKVLDVLKTLGTSIEWISKLQDDIIERCEEPEPEHEADEDEEEYQVDNEDEDDSHAEQCVYVPKSAFKEIVLEISKKNAGDMKWSANSILLLHVNMEGLLLQVFHDAAKCASNAHRETILPKDLQLVMYIKRLSQVLEW